MHFGTSIYCVTPSRDVLLVVSPMDLFMMIGMAIIIGVLTFCAIFFRAPRRYVLTFGFLGAVVTVGAASNDTLTLDAGKNTAIIHTVFLAYSQTYR
ncbi:MAG: hypothetical protein ACRYFU_10465 [Janthinobacterium lividum]